MGHDDHERRRLALQTTILNPFTEQLLRRAGISTGMHVLDLGCSIGDVSLRAARLVGRHGTVTAIDIDPKALAIAADRARAQALANLQFVEGISISINQSVPSTLSSAAISWVIRGIRSRFFRSRTNGCLRAVWLRFRNTTSRRCTRLIRRARCETA